MVDGASAMGLDLATVSLLQMRRRNVVAKDGNCGVWKADLTKVTRIGQQVSEVACSQYLELNMRTCFAGGMYIRTHPSKNVVTTGNSGL